MSSNDDQKVIIFVGPSGSGKTSIARAVMRRIPRLAFSVSATTRPPRNNERDGRDYYFIDADTFRQWIAEGRLLEHEEVYPGIYYGTPRHELERIRDKGKVPLLDIDINGALRIREAFPGALILFIHPGNESAIIERLQHRQTETPEQINKRLRRIRYELDMAARADHIIYNQNLGEAVDEAERIIRQYLNLKEPHRVGLFPGTFNPVHHGHLFVAEYMANYTDLQQIWFVLTPQNPFKNPRDLPDEYARKEILELAIRDNPAFRLSDVEFRLPRPNYTIQTLLYLSDRFPSYDFTLIMGSDAYETFPQWRHADLIKRDYRIFVYERPRHAIRPIPQHPNIRYFSDVPQVLLSATFIRRALAEGKSIRYLVPEAVRQYLEKWNIYRRHSKASGPSAGR